MEKQLYSKYISRTRGLKKAEGRTESMRIVNDRPLRVLLTCSLA